MEHGMRVLVDNRWLGPTGIGRYADEILNRKPAGVEIVPLDESFPIKDPLTPIRLHAAIRRVRPDVFWSPGFMPPVSPTVPFVFTIHDTIHLEFGNSWQRTYYNYVIRPIARRAASVLTVSEYSRGRILEWSGLAPEKVIATPLGIADEFCEHGPSYDMGKRYVLYVGNRRIYKNVDRLIRGFAKADIDRDIILALSGDYDARLQAIASQAGVSNRLVFMGSIREEELPAVYRGATAFAYVSLSEGFGLPPLEAMACGTPVVVSNTTSLPEVVGAAALLVDPTDEISIANALGLAINDATLRSRLRFSGLEQARKYSWVRCAALTWQQIQAAATR